MDNKLKYLLDTMRSGDDAAQKRYLADLLTKGQQAEDLKSFLDDWLRIEEQTALKDLDSPTKSADDVKRDYQAAMRLYHYMTGIIEIAKQKRSNQKGE
ncbi:hypothetical protein ACE418_03135 [Megasphaera sp. WILCCON 0056]|uniref:hypothetical protein n=1 Tax=Megasphaera sp. WILCCON 0056 TaxID=3345340 RepID=UPI003A80A334